MEESWCNMCEFCKNKKEIIQENYQDGLGSGSMKLEYEERKLYFLTFLNQIMETCKCKNFLQNASFARCAAESWWKNET